MVSIIVTHNKHVIVSVSNQQSDEIFRQALKKICTDVENKGENVMEFKKENIKIKKG